MKGNNNSLIRDREEHMNNLENFENLPNIVLIPNHGKQGFLPSYPLCGKREIFCGPNLQNIESLERKYIRTNGRFFDIKEVISQLNKNDQRIDLVFIPLEVNVACFPKNLKDIKCPKIALVFDTHHLMYSISSLIKYLKYEEFTHLFIYAQPAHLHFFYEAGFTHSASFPHTAQHFETIDHKKSGVTYIGKKWKNTHPRRCRMLKFLEKQLPRNNIPFHYYNRLPRSLWHKVLARSRFIVISSLNGQVTPQINNCLFAGALCFVDELSSQTSLYRFFKPGTHIVTWRNFEELLEKLIYYHDHPKEAETIAKAGQFQAYNSFTTSKSSALSISEFVFNNKVDSRLLAINDKRCQSKRVESPELFNARVRLYENIQELHRIHENLTMITITERNLKPTSDLADLPRLQITHASISDRLKNEAYSYFQSVGVDHQVQTTLLYKIHSRRTFDIGILETQENQVQWEFLVKAISTLLKSNSLLWILGEMTSNEKEILKREGFYPYVGKTASWRLKIKNLSQNLCFLFWKFGFYPYPYLTLKPAMRMVPNLNVFLRGWQSHFPFLY